jgi:hypothetical protein
MAGKTLSGIGEDESGRHEIGGDTSNAAVDVKMADKTPSVRPTDRMPMVAGPSPTKTVFGLGPMSSVDEDKVAEGLKKLRSLDEPLGPIPTSPTPQTLRDAPLPQLTWPPPNPMAGTPTLKEGMPVVGLPTPVTPAALAAAAAADIIRSRGTAHGHALSAAAGAQSSLPVTVDDRLKGTLLGHDLHLPDLPALPPEEKRSAEIRPVASPSTVSVSPAALVPEPMPTAFAQGDSHFFDSEPINNEYEPEQRSNKMLVRGAIAFAAAAVAVVVIVAATRHKDDSAPVEAQTSSSAPAPAPAAAAEPPAAAAPEPAPAVAPAPTPAVAPAPARPPIAAAPAEEVRPAVAAPAAHAARPKHSSAPAAKPAAVAHAARPAVAHDNPKPVPAAKRGKDEDPDGTLPLTE